MSEALGTEFVGRKGAYFWLSLKTGLLTILTLGFYRFWMKTRLRRYMWSAIRPGGHPMEYLGTPLEKLLGFLVAVVFLAFYIGIVNLILMFASFSLFAGNGAAYALSFIGILPIIFFAQYRARRYILARTRWRGIRFGLEPGAWGYAWRAALHWLATIATAGLLLPRQVFYLEKYRADRTFFGDKRLHQGGTWTMLYPPMKHLLIAVGLTVGTVLAGAYGDESTLFILPVALFWLMFGAIHFRVQSLRLLTSHKTLGGIALKAEPKTGRVMKIYSVGYALVYTVVGALFFGLFIVIFAAVMSVIGGAAQMGAEFDVEMFQALSNVPFWITTALTIMLYFTIFLMWNVLSQVFVGLPLAAHYAQSLSVQNPGALTDIRQRPRDEFAEAEGFAEALDVGAAI
ncbi:DUF898 domain-containing protein [Cognatishimia sp. MH4019]|uniref:DUF898 domain-containing protein n=1 Tax=Cognatishimia sp. MH4019 TaxID=2854030 RepID=UPI001CD42D71|nr:DUF898 domain-containing protein [Cognatishimia sp. MH4019]